MEIGRRRSGFVRKLLTVSELYDQSPKGNNLTIEGPGGAGPSFGQDIGANATALPVTAGGNEVYGIYIPAKTGYRNDATSGVAVNGQPEGMYMVVSGTHVNSGCCYDFGNAETSLRDTGASHMDAVNITAYCDTAPCNGSGPWVEADLENGQYLGSGSNPNNTTSNSNFVTAVLKNNGQTTFELKGGNAQSGGMVLKQHAADPRPVPGHHRGRHRDRHQGRTMGLQRRRQPSLETTGQRLPTQPPVRPVPRLPRRQYRQQHATADLYLQRHPRPAVPPELTAQRQPHGPEKLF